MAFQKNQNFLKKFLQKLGQVVVVLLSVYEILIAKKRSFFAYGSKSLLEVILRLKVQKNNIDLLSHLWTCDFTLKKEKKLNVTSPSAYMRGRQTHLRRTLTSQPKCF